MRVAVVHGYYSSRVPSGENVVVDLQVEALRGAGHDVEVFARRQDEVEQVRGYAVGAAARVATGLGPAPDLDRFAPDVVHVHNLFPNYGRRWARRWSDRLVATLHNYRPICPAATLFRDGGACTLCPDSGSSLPALRHACYKDSRVATLPMVLGTRFAADPLLRSAARVITLNDDMQARYRAVGVPAEALVTVPNFVPDPGPREPDADGYWLYVGRLSEEKGIRRIVRDWPVGHRLLVAGSGPLQDELAAAARPGVDLLGQVDHDRVLDLLAGARGLVFPSLWPEGLPTIYLEALASGTPVLASPESVVGSLVRSEGTGRILGSDLAGDLEAAAAAFPGLQARCRTAFAERYTEAAWLEAVQEVYRSVATDPARRGPGRP